MSACSTTRLKRRLRKEIIDKGEVIISLQHQIDDLTDTNKHLIEKVLNLELEFSEEIEKKQKHIKGLELTIKDYQDHISELQTPNDNENSLNVFNELVDSCAQAVANLPGTGVSTENLGQLVDIQDENSKLNKEFIDLIEVQNQKIQSFIQDQLKQAKEHEELASEKDVASLEIESEKYELTRLKHLENSVSSHLAEISSVLQCIKKENDELNAEVSCLNACLVEAKDDFAAAEELLSKITAQCEELLSEKSQMEKERDELNSVVGSRLNTFLFDAKADLAAAEELHSKLSAHSEELLLEKCKMEKEKDELSAEVTRLTTCLVDSIANLTTVEELHSKFVARNEELLLEKRQLETERDELNDEVSYLTDCLAKAKNKLTTSEEVHFNLSTLNEGLLLQVTHQTSQIKSLTTNVYESKEETERLNETIVELKTQIEGLKTENRMINSSVAELTAVNQSIQLEFQSQRRQLQSMESTCQDLKTQFIQSEDEKELLFLSLEEKVNEVEAIEMDLNNFRCNIKVMEVTNCELSTEKTDLSNQVIQLKSNCFDQSIKINELQNAGIEFTSKNKELIEASDKLRLKIDDDDKYLVELRSELEMIHHSAEQEVIDIQQLTATNAVLEIATSTIKAELNLCRSKLSDVSAELDTKTIESIIAKEIVDNERIENEQKLNDLKVEIEEVKKNFETLEMERHALLVRLQNADHKLIDSQEVVESKNDKITVHMAQNSEFATRSEALLNQESIIGDGKNKRPELVKQLTNECHQNKILLAEKERLINSMSHQVTKLSHELRKISLEFESAKSCKELLSINCASLTDDLQETESKHNDFQNIFVEGLEQSDLSKKCENNAFNLLEAEQKCVTDLQLQYNEEQMAEFSELTNQQVADLNLKLISGDKQLTSSEILN